jgi:hypothetical protein
MTHDYERHGTTTLFAAMNVLDGTVIGRNMQRHRHQEFIRFLNVIEKQVPAGKTIHAVVDNYAVHKHPNVRGWLERHPRWTFHFTPTSASALTRSRASSRPSQSAGSSAASFGRSPTCKPRSTDSSKSTINNRSLHLDSRSRQNHRRRQARTPSVRFDPLGRSDGPDWWETKRWRKQAPVRRRAFAIEPSRTGSGAGV